MENEYEIYSEETNVRYVVSDNFIHCYNKICLLSIREDIILLPRKEKILLIHLLINRYPLGNDLIYENTEPLLDIMSIMSDPNNLDPDFIELENLTDSKFINTNIIIDKHGNRPGTALSEEQIKIDRRKLKIINIL